MKTVIPLPGDKSVLGESRHGRFITGDKFSWEGNLYQFLGRDSVGGLHARSLHDSRLVVFESSHQWEVA